MTTELNMNAKKKLDIYDFFCIISIIFILVAVGASLLIPTSEVLETVMTVNFLSWLTLTLVTFIYGKMKQ